MIDRRRSASAVAAGVLGFVVFAGQPPFLVDGAVRTAHASDATAIFQYSNKKERKRQRETHNVQADRATVVERKEFVPVVIEIGAGVEVRSADCVATPGVCEVRRPVTAGSAVIVERGAIEPFAVITGYVGGVVSTTSDPKGAEAALNYYESQGGIGPDPLIIGVGAGYVRNTSVVRGNDPVRAAIDEANRQLLEAGK